MKLKLDENIGHGGAELLRTFGHDVSTVRLQKLEGAPDDELFEICVREQRALITLDHDFGSILRFPPGQSAGIAVLELGPKPSLRAMNERLSELAATLKIHFLDRSLWIVEPGRVRMYTQDNGE